MQWLIYLFGSGLAFFVGALLILGAVGGCCTRACSETQSCGLNTKAGLLLAIPEHEITPWKAP